MNSFPRVFLTVLVMAGLGSGLRPTTRPAANFPAGDAGHGCDAVVVAHRCANGNSARESTHRGASAVP